MKIGKKGTAYYGFISGLLLSAIGTLTPNSTHAGILSVSNDVTVISPPPSAVAGAFSNNQIYLFPERTALLLTNNILVDISDPGFIPITNNFFLSPTNLFAGTTVDSYYLHHGGADTNTASGSVTFDSDVIGIICLTSNLVTSQRFLGAPGTTYQPTRGTQGYELGPLTPSDRIQLSANRRTVTVNTTGITFSPDDLRIITASPPPPLPPIADAQSNQVVYPGNFAALSGYGSRDPNNPPLPLSYLWTQVSGIPVTIQSSNTPVGFFVAPDVVPDAGAVLTFQLEVSNGFASSSDIVSIEVVGADNVPPIAKAGPNQIIGENSLVTLDGSSSFDYNYGDPLTFQWSQISGPLVTLTGADTINPTFTAPEVTHAQGSNALKFQLVVNDGKINSGPSIVTVTAININDAPIANAGPNQSVDQFVTVLLNGTASSDPDGNPLTYSWAQILGPSVSLRNAHTATPNFDSPQVDAGNSITLTFQLTVSDGIASSTSTVDVQVSHINHIPVADAGPDITIPSGLFVTLIGTNGSFDPDGDPLSYQWFQTAGPQVTLFGTNSGSAFFQAPNVGPSGATLTFHLTVVDIFGSFDTDDVNVNVTYVNHPPTINAGAPQTVNEGSLATLTGIASDPDANPLSIQWTEVSGPAITLLNDTTLTPSFIAPSVTRGETNVVFALTVDDGFGGIVSSNTTVHIANVNHAPVAQPPANMTVPENSAVTLIGQGTDPDTEEQSQLVYSWAQIGGPAVSLSGAGPNASFTAPVITAGGDPNAQVTLTFALTVTDPNGASGTASVDVLVANVNHGPTAVAGNNLTVNEGSSVTLNGSASSDPDSDPLTYSWVQVSGPAITLRGANTAFPQFTAPFVGTAGATLQFQLTVNDGFGGTNTATTTVTVNNINTPPNIDQAAPSISTLRPPNHGMLQVSILGVIDPDQNDTITVTSVSQDEPTNGLGDGDTSTDAVINSDGTVLLRAERDSNGNGRVYHIHFTASDLEGSISGVVNVSVPVNKKTDAAIDDGELYDSTQ